MTRFHTWSASLLVAAFVLTACGGGGSGSAPTSSLPDVTTNSIAQSALAARNWSIQAGASTLDQAFQDLDYYASTITIDAGDTVTWRIAAKEPHTISFLAPGQKPPSPLSPQATAPAGGSTEDGTTFTSSGLIAGTQTYTLRFPKPGTYTFMCLIHQPVMLGKIIVQNAGTPYPHDQAFYTHQGSVDLWNDLFAGVQSVALFPYPDRGTTLTAGISPGLAAGPPSQSTVLRFLNRKSKDNINYSGNVIIKVNTTLTFVDQSNNEPHTVTLPIAGQPLPNVPPFIPPSGLPNGTYDGTVFTNSGILLPGQSYHLKFTKPGSYQYFCLFHDDEGMKGFITVTK
jgi:plastocyanin